jgi:hypothetical protein
MGISLNSVSNSTKTQGRSLKLRLIRWILLYGISLPLKIETVAMAVSGTRFADIIRDRDDMIGFLLSKSLPTAEK